MQDRLDNFLKMVNLLLQFFADNVIIMTIAPAVGAVVEKVKSQRDAINDLLEKRGGKASGLAETKNALQVKLAKKANRILLALHSWAAGNNMPDLSRATNLSVWKLLKLRDKALVDKSKEIHDLAEPYVDKLAGYNIKAEDIDYLISGGEEYGGLITEVGKIMKGKSGTTITLEQAEEDLRNMIDHELDAAVEAALSEEHKDLLAKYEKVREVTDYGVRHEAKPEENTPAQP